MKQSTTVTVFCGGIGTETNTFSPLPTGLQDFTTQGYFKAGTHPRSMSRYSAPLSGALERADLGWNVHQGLFANAQPAGITSRETYESLRDELLADLRAVAPVDLVLLGLHGAMVADGYDDCEGDILQRVREITGPETVIGCELDAHAHVSHKMVSHADVLVAYKEYPHWDIKDRADELVELCAKAVRGEVHITGSLVDTGIIIPIHTSREPGKGLVADLKKLEESPNILTASIIHGFATGDVADMGTRVLIYTDNDVRLANTSASFLAERLRDARNDFSIEYLSVNEALDASRAEGPTPVVLADRADNPGSGAAGDSTFVLGQLIENGFDRTALGPLWDPAAVQICFAAGVGATISLRIGGKTGPMSGNPLDVQCVVKNLKRDHTQTNLTGEPLAVGDTALIDIGGIECVLTSIRTQALDTALFTGVGCVLDEKDLVVVKSAHHFYKSFSTVSERVLYVGAPGSATPNWSDLTYEKASLPKWPITAELGPMVSMWP